MKCFESNTDRLEFLIIDDGLTDQLLVEIIQGYTDKEYV